MEQGKWYAIFTMGMGIFYLDKDPYPIIEKAQNEGKLLVDFKDEKPSDMKSITPVDRNKFPLPYVRSKIALNSITGIFELAKSNIVTILNGGELPSSKIIKSAGR